MDSEVSYQEDQVYTLDIDKIYNDFIKYIDSKRSNVNVNDPNNQNLFNKITASSFSGSFINSLKSEFTSQESRCHAFYRLIGFPVSSSQGKIYNPGHDTMVEEGRNVTAEFKAEVANDPYPEFKKLVDKREIYLNDFLSIFANRSSIDSWVMALSSSNFRESFAAPFKVEDPLDFNPENQSYNISDKGLSYEKTILFKEYLNNAETPPEKYTNKRYHIIKPFLVDARIELSAPSSKKISVPFAKGDSFLKVSDIASVEKPMIEKVIVDRFAPSDDLDKIGSASQNVVEYIKKFSLIKDESLIKDISSGKIFKITDQKMFEKYFNIIRSMMLELYKAKNKIIFAQKNYYYLPIPGPNGTESGSSINPVFPRLIDTLNTPKDNKIAIASFNNNLASLSREIASMDGTPDPGGYALSKFTNAFDPTTSGSFKSNSAKSLEDLNERRSEVLKQANEALKTIEIINGEFSGLGLCDIIVIMGALYLMPTNSLLGFLDQDAYERAKLFVKGIPETNPSTINQALSDLGKTALSFYNIADKIYKDLDRDE